MNKMMRNACLYLVLVVILISFSSCTGMKDYFSEMSYQAICSQMVAQDENKIIEMYDILNKYDLTISYIDETNKANEASEIEIENSSACIAGTVESANVKKDIGKLKDIYKGLKNKYNIITPRFSDGILEFYMYESHWYFYKLVYDPANPAMPNNDQDIRYITLKDGFYLYEQHNRW